MILRHAHERDCFIKVIIPSVMPAPDQVRNDGSGIQVYRIS
jgi:hypothetical protein